MDANRRQHLRQPISLSALVHPPEGRSWLCTIRDFCQSGMLLTGSGGSSSLLASGSVYDAGSEISLHFSVATPTGQLHFRLPCVVARVLDNGAGLGIRYPDELPADAFDALLEYAVASGTVSRREVTGKAGSSAADEPGGSAAKATPGQVPDELLRDHRVSEVDAERIKRRLRRVMERAVERVSRNFFDSANKNLLAKARDAGTNAMQMMYFEGLDQLEKGADQVKTTFADLVLKQIDQVSEFEEVLEKRRRRDTGNTQKLELVDTEEFEDWLIVAEVISKAEGRFNDALLDLRTWLELIAKPWGHKDVVPIGPAVLTWAFADAIENLEFRRNVKQEVFSEFQNVLIPVLESLYTALSTMLDETGVFPSVEELRTAQQRAEQPAAVQQPQAEAQEPTEPPDVQDPENYQEMDSAVREAAMAVDGVSQPRAMAGHDPFSPSVRGGTAEVYKAARELLSLGRQTRERMGQQVDDLLVPEDAPAEARFAPDDIMNAFQQIQSELGDASLGDERLKPRLVEVLRQQHGDAKGFGPAEYDTINVMENLVDSMRQDELVTEGVRDWIKRLEITLNKVAATDEKFLEHTAEEPHSAAMMLNLLARLGNTNDVSQGIDREVGRRVDAVLERVVNDYDENPQVIQEAVDELNPLIDRQTKAYRGNVERTVRASEGQQKLARARRAVVDEVGDRIADQEVPDLLVELLNPGWRNLMVHTYLRHGIDSPEWRDALGVVDQVKQHLAGEVQPGDEDYVDPEDVLKRVVTGLNDISFDPSKRTPLVMKLSSAMVGDTTGERLSTESIVTPKDDLVETLGLDGLLPETDPAIETEDEDLRSSWTTALERARRIQVGEWLAMSDDNGRPLILTIAFVGDQYTLFVLVNRKGVKTKELSLKQLTDGLHRGEITLLDDYDMPLMERASQRMLQNMHNQLAYQASHDELTSLLNRKEFERCIEKAINQAKADHSESALFHLDLDQFKIINNTSGHAAGDALLQHLGTLLADFAEPYNANVARLGGDEFGLHFENLSAEDVRRAGEELLETMRAERFTWEDRVHSLSASLGLVFVDESSDVQETLVYAEEACYTAKESGRNRLQEFELGDTRMKQRQGVMEWVTELDKALDDERLVLNCQKIVPINQHSQVQPHYEILLTMKDEEGNMMPPAEFILAAETYNRMVQVDRWVIKNVFEWVSEHRDELDDISGFAINISGHSMNDEAFADFVLEQFTQTQTPTAKVCFEVTETAAISNLDNAVDFMNRMKIIGCRFSLDDFGTGLSSYSYLRNLPVDYVKIDGVFVRDLADSPGDYAVVRSINEIGHYMGKKTIAEFVENEEILAQLREIGVDYAQGYGIHRPTPLAELQLKHS